MIMIDRSRRLSEPLHWGRREKVAVAVVVSEVGRVTMRVDLVGPGLVLWGSEEFGCDFAAAGSELRSDSL